MNNCAIFDLLRVKFEYFIAVIDSFNLMLQCDAKVNFDFTEFSVNN